MKTRAITNHISIGGQPDESGIGELQSAGIRTIVNLRTPQEEGVLAEEEHLVEGKGMNYSEIPVTPELLDDLAMQRFTGAVEGDDRPPVFVHCGSGGRAGVMTLLHLAVEEGWTVDEAYAAGRQLEIAPGEESPYRRFFEDYIRRHSAGERA